MFSRFFISSSASKRYRCLGFFTPNTPSIQALSISNDGSLVACGGTNGIYFWKIDECKELTSYSHDALGTVSCMTWIKTKHTTVETICYGTGLGYLVFLRPNPADQQFQQICAQRLGSAFEVTCLAWDKGWSKSGARIAVGMRNSVVEVLELDTNAQLQSVFAGQLNATVPKSIAFVQHESVHIFGLYDGKVIKLKDTTGAVLSEHRCGAVIGCAAVSARRELVAINNATDGFTLYPLGSGNPIRTYFTDPPSVPVPKQVAFGEDSKVVIRGSDCGMVYVFERRSGLIFEKIAHASAGLVQTIDVRDVGGCCIVASASPANGRRKTLVRVWAHQFDTKNDTKSTKVPKGSRHWSVCGGIMRILTTSFMVIVALVAGCWLQANVVSRMAEHVYRH
ncbi:WD40-repeat-containing domain protein [Boletus edulis BED1]|uniref:WD40-repeat-containing domain protein n=1 Tax=Boletus edulis BED1 TaxID=1328754 RepID=A0AAD4G7V8_BOLED|nr:WD40-repeat-containing domain protein [Boletus edulis BED1]